MRDMASSIHPLVAVTPVVVTDDTAQVGKIIDTKGYGTCTFVIASGALVDADVTVTALLEHGDASDLADAAAVADEDLVGTEALAVLGAGDDEETRKIGYIGYRRYVRLTLTPANNTGGAALAALAFLGRAATRPTANPPV